MSMINCVSPVDGSVYVQRPIAEDGAVDRAFASARKAQREWRRLSVAERGAFCTRAVDAMLAMGDDIVPELAWQMGRPVRFGAGELGGFEERARHMIAIAEASLEDLLPEPKAGFSRYIKREPLGVVLTIAPWNFPLLTAVNSIVPALMAGNAVVLKHASHTLLVGERFQQAFDAAGLPDGMFQNLVLSHEQTARILSSRLTDMVCFTGSVGGGKSMEAAAQGQFLPMGLELGGKDPAYVRADVDVAHAIENVADGAFFNSGQSCCGIERIYVHDAVYEAFVEGLVELTRGYVLGNPLEEETTLGPLVKTAAADFVRSQLAAAERSGATLHLSADGFAADTGDSAYLAPQVLTDVNHQMAVMSEETFGPVAGIMKVSSDDEAVALMNDSEFGLTASIWTRDEAAAVEIGEGIETGTVFMNRCDYLDPALAWTGVKNTGRGCTLSQVGYEALTRPKSFHLRTDIS
jgi:acyl-CoA reductase-like NAD-dependent aldehyde dehydrogenase